MARHTKGEAFTLYGWSVCAWILVIAFQYGYHISALNQIQAVLTCSATPKDLVNTLALPCIPMSNFTFSIVTAIFTIGGLIGSTVANLVMDRWGRKGATKVSALLITSGAGVMSLSTNVPAFLLGRLFIGIGSGVGLCVVPIYLAEIAPFHISGNIGVLTQLAIVFGIMITQAIGLRLATPTQWRMVLFFSFGLCVVQLIFSPLIPESPAWLKRAGKLEESEIVRERLTGFPSGERRHDVEDPLLESVVNSRQGNKDAPVTIPKALLSPDLRKPLIIICFAMLSQQLSGINAVLYYSNAILSKSLPDFGPYVSLGITVVNVLMTFPPILLIERMGRKALLSVSLFGAILSLVLVGFGLNNSLVTVSSMAIITFVMSFAIGLGPIPFVMISEVAPPHAVSALSSIALSLNWIVNFFVGLVFLPLRDLLSGGGDISKEGRVFYLFAVILSASSFVLLGRYRG
ncbi:General substrate transporter [Amanita muscaria]